MMSSFFDLGKLERQSLRESIESAKEFLKGTVLDLGSGEQPYASIVKERAAQYWGIDIKVSADKKADVCGDSLLLPFKDNTFDAILCTQVLEHVRDPFALFNQVSRVLKDGGYLILTAPQSWPLHEEPYDFYRYTRFGLSELAKRNGLNVVIIKERGGGIAAIGQLTAAILYDIFGNRRITRAPVKIAAAPFLSLCRFIDKMLYYPKLTLGYLVVARKAK